MTNKCVKHIAKTSNSKANNGVDNTHTYLVQWNTNEGESFTNLIEVPAGLPWHDPEGDPISNDIADMDVPLYIKHQLNELDDFVMLEDYRRIKGIIELD